MTGNANLWAQSVNELVSLYRKVERRGLALPAFSLAPLGIYIWNTIKFEVCLLLDLFLLIPLNLVIFLRNILPGKWPYQSFSWKYIKYVILWVWRGEAPIGPTVVVRSLVVSLLASHFRKSLLSLRRHIFLEVSLAVKKQTFTPGQQTLLLSDIDNALKQWQERSFMNVVYTHVFPTVGFLVGMVPFLTSAPSPPAWLGPVVLFLVIYSLGFVTTAFLVKRGLMLGGYARLSYFPGALKREGAYAEEDRIFESIGAARKEFPLDIVFMLLGIPLGYFMTIRVLSGSPDEQKFIIQSLPWNMVPVLLNGLSLFRRAKLRRR